MLIHPVMDASVVSTFQLLGVVRLCIFGDKYLFEYLLSFLLGI